MAHKQLFVLRNVLHAASFTNITEKNAHQLQTDHRTRSNESSMFRGKNSYVMYY